MKIKNILIIDDDRELSSIVKDLLHYYGYDAMVVHEPKKGIEVAKKRQPDLILLDVLMPSMNGREVCKVLKRQEETKNIPVIFLTAKDSADDIAGEIEAGGSGHFSKPFDSKKLLEKIKELLHQ